MAEKENPSGRLGVAHSTLSLALFMGLRYINRPLQFIVFRMSDDTHLRRRFG